MQTGFLVGKRNMMRNWFPGAKAGNQSARQHNPVMCALDSAIRVQPEDLLYLKQLINSSRMLIGVSEHLQTAVTAMARRLRWSRFDPLAHNQWHARNSSEHKVAVLEAANVALRAELEERARVALEQSTEEASTLKAVLEQTRSEHKGKMASLRAALQVSEVREGDFTVGRVHQADVDPELLALIRKRNEIDLELYQFAQEQAKAQALDVGYV